MGVAVLAVLAAFLAASLSHAERTPSSVISETELNAAREVIVNNDCQSGMFGGGFRTKQELQDYVSRFDETDTTGLEWCICGAVFFTDTKVGDILGDGITDEQWTALRRGDRVASDTLHRLIAEGNDPLTVVAAQGKANGLSVFASLRMNSFYAPPWDVLGNGKFWRDHLDLRIATPGGDFVPNLSYAYPEIRQWWLDIVAEAAQRDVAGVNLDYLRHSPFFGREKVLVDGYARLYGAPPPADPEWWKGTFTPEALAQHKKWIKWWRFRAALMTDWLRKARAEMDQAEKRWGHPIKVSVRIDHRYYLPQRLDVETWVKEGLVDYLVVSEESLGGFDIDLTPFRRMVKGTKCKLIFGEESVTEGHDLTPEEDKALARGENLNLQYHNLTTLEYCRRAERWYTEGADGIEIFNGPADWETLRALGSLAKARRYIAAHGNEYGCPSE